MNKFYHNLLQIYVVGGGFIYTFLGKCQNSFNFKSGIFYNKTNFSHYIFFDIYFYKKNFYKHFFQTRGFNKKMFYKALKEHKSVIEFLRFKQNYKDEIFNYTYNYINNFKGYYENKIFTNIQLYTNRQIKALNKIQRNFNDYKVFNYNNFNFKNFAPSFYEKFIFTTYGQNFYNRILFENFIKRYYPQFLFLHFKTKGVNEFNNPYFTNVSYKNIKFFNSNTLSNFLTYKSKKKVEKNFTSYQNLYNYNFQQAFSNKDFQQNTIIKYEEIQKEIMLLKSNFSTSKGKNTNVDFESLYEKIKERIFEEVFFMSGGFY